MGYDEMKTLDDTLVNDNIMLLKENDTLKSTVSELSGCLGSLEQHLREKNVEIHGVPEHHNENLPNLLKQCFHVVGSDFKVDDIVKCTRVVKLNKESKLPRTIIVKLKSSRKRDEFYAVVYRYDKRNPSNKLNTSLLRIGGDTKTNLYVGASVSC